VFGGLDPLITPLYFAAGGEIFDGLSWLRYAFKDGLSIQREAAALLDRKYEKRIAMTVQQVQIQNLDVVTELSRDLKIFFDNECDWARLRNGSLLQPAFEAMKSELGRKYGR
jgi:hypothetical protein